MKFDPITQYHFAIDQEDGELVYTPDGVVKKLFIPDEFLAALPCGGGMVEGDHNSWAVRNKLSHSAFGWMKQKDRDDFLSKLHAAGYREVDVDNTTAGKWIYRYDVDPADAVLAMWREAQRQVLRNGSFDSGHAIRPTVPDKSYGQRAIVTESFLTVQNMPRLAGYNSPFGNDVLRIAYAALKEDFSHTERAAFRNKAKSDGLELPKYLRTLGGSLSLFNMKAGSPELIGTQEGHINGSLRPLVAIATSVYNPLTGELRLHRGKPWGTKFITRHVIGLNGAGRGKGVKGPGNPMRAALRSTGKGKNRPVLGEYDRLIRVLIRAFRAHGPIRPVNTEA